MKHSSRRSVSVNSFNLLGYHKNRYCLVPNKMDQVAMLQKITDIRKGRFQYHKSSIWISRDI